MTYGIAIKSSRRRLCKAGLVGLLLLALVPRGPARPVFDADRAMELIRYQCLFGPRVPGTSAHANTREWIGDQLRQLDLHVWEQPFQTKLPLTGASVQAVNIWGAPTVDGPTSPVIVLSAHWDTRPWADHDPSGLRPPLDGANDGASGVAMALELARALRANPIRDHLALAFWDAEDAGLDRRSDSWALGSRFAAENPPPWVDRIALGINLDMVAGRDLLLRRESRSQEIAPRAVNRIWEIGLAVAPSRFSDAPARPVIDDHLPWIEAGVPFIDLIGLPYRHWHTAGDNVDRCSPEALNDLGGVLIQYLLSGDWKRPSRN